MDLTQLFPGQFKSKDDIVYGPSVAKLRGDDLKITTRLIKKYGDNIDKMFKDIKLNYMQWSKGELKKKILAYQAHHTNKEENE